MPILRIAAACALVLVAAGPARAQGEQPAPPARETQELRLRDGSVMYGRVEREEGEEIVLRTVAGVERPERDAAPLRSNGTGAQAR